MVSYSIKLDNDLQLVRVEVIGVLNQTAGKQIITEARSAASENGYDLLYDMRRCAIKVSISNWFRLPRDLDVFKQAAARLVKAAIVISKTDKAIDEYIFFENVARNLGFSLKIHFTEDEALPWLDRKK